MDPGASHLAGGQSRWNNGAEQRLLCSMMRAIKPGGELDSVGEAAFEDFFLAEYDSLMRAMWLLTGSRAEGEDLAQEAMARACERWDKVQGATNPVAYVYTIAFNLNRRRLRTLVGARLFSPEEAPVHDLAGDVARRADVLQAIRRLPRKQREALLLVEWLGLSPEEASGLLGVEPVSVRVRLHRARNDLRRVLGGSDE